MDVPLILGLVILGLAVVIGLAVFFVLKKKQKQDDEPEEEPVRRHRSNGNHKNKNRVDTEPKMVKSPRQDSVAEKKSVQEEKFAETDDVEDGDELEGEWDWGASSASASTIDDTKVSVQDVDPLTEFNVYKKFGYVDKAAESLAAYLQNHPEKNQDKSLVGELLDLWLEAKKTDEFSDALGQYQNLFDTEVLAEYIKKGLAIDENHLGLRVLAETRLGWTVKQTATEIGESTEVPSAAGTERVPGNSARKKAEERADGQAKTARKELVAGTVSLSTVSNEEKGAVLAFMKPEQSVKLLKGILNYETSNRYLNKAIRASAKPAALLIDALTMDFKAKNLNSFVEHLWNLYYSLGQGGRQVKERMLGLGYSMGEHPVFGALETNPTDSAVLREIGIRHGFVEASSAAKKGRYKNLVTEISDSGAEPKTPAERVLKEAEFYLMYGQLDESMNLLEGAIKEYPQESQLYITLFDLYERAEEWGRLESLLKDLRMQIQSLPEEVVLAMSQLLQRFNNGSFGR